ncbi:hypothetical protein CaCOL14_005020 [Colletotrichum acutatum]
MLPSNRHQCNWPAGAMVAHQTSIFSCFKRCGYLGVVGSSPTLVIFLQFLLISLFFGTGEVDFFLFCNFSLIATCSGVDKVLLVEDCHDSLPLLDQPQLDRPTSWEQNPLGSCDCINPKLKGQSIPVWNI